MNRIHEVLKVLPAILAQSMTAGATVTGTYHSLANASKEGVLFNVNFGALPEGKKVTVQVFEADDDAATNETELTEAKTIFTAGAGGVTSGQILVSLLPSAFSREFATIKVTNDKATALLGNADLLVESNLRGADLNDHADALTVA